MIRHAALIMAHDEPQMLRQLIDEIDDERIDIYVHIDRKAPFDGCGFNARRSRLTILPQRIDGRWGDYSLVTIELELLRAATVSGVDYARYHLLSGRDMLVAPVDRIVEECAAMPDAEYIGIARHAPERELRWRSRHRFPFARRFSSRNPGLRLLRRICVMAQNAAGYRRCRLMVAKGPQWWSITDSFARYVLDHAVWIEDWFRATYCPDEMVFQTLCLNSEFASRLHAPDDEFEGCKRYIVWKNGQLRPLTTDDILSAREKGRWFARKRPEVPTIT